MTFYNYIRMIFFSSYLLVIKHVKKYNFIIFVRYNGHIAYRHAFCYFSYSDTHFKDSDTHFKDSDTHFKDSDTHFKDRNKTTCKIFLKKELGVLRCHYVTTK